MYRNEGDAKKSAGGSGSVIADFADKASMRKALDGVEVLYLVCSPIPQLVELESKAIDVCAEKGVRYVVLNSALGAGECGKSFPAWHNKVEEKLKGTKLGWAILRPNGFMQNIVTYNAPTIRAQGVFYAAMGNAKTSVIDVRDIAEVAAKILAAPNEHNGKTYELNGPEAVSNDEVAERISRATGRTVKYVDIPEEAQRKAMLDAGMPEWQVKALLELQEYYRERENAATVTDVLPQLLGHAPRTLDRFSGREQGELSQPSGRGVRKLCRQWGRDEQA